MDPTLRQWMNASVLWEPFTGYDGRGKPSYGPGKQLMCYPTRKNIIVRDRTGEEVLSQWVLVTDNPEVASMLLQDRLTLPSGEQLLVKRIDHRYGTKGEVDHYEVYI